MKKTVTTAVALAACLAAGAQTMKIQTGEVTYLIPASQASNITFSGSETIKAKGKEIAISDIDKISIDDSSVADDNIVVTYNGNSASVAVAGNIMKYVTVTANGSDVSIIQDESLETEITYTLKGTSSDGSFYMDGEYKATVVLDNLLLTNADGAPIDIENGKRINIELVGSNVLVDSEDGSQKGCMMVNGHAEFTGSGTLSLTGNAKHAFWGDEYVLLKKSMTGTITVENAVKDAFNVNEHFEQRAGQVVIKACGDDGIQVSYEDATNPTDDDTGSIIISGGILQATVTGDATKALKAEGNITINDAYSTPTVKLYTHGDGTWDDDDQETKACAGISADGNITIDAGTITLNSTGSGGKGMKCDGDLTINGGTIDASTTGNRFTYGSNGNREGSQYSAYRSSPKGLKADGTITINGGTITVKTTGTYGEGIESKYGNIYIKGGTIDVNSYDDGINASASGSTTAGDIRIQGGTVTVYATNNDGIDSNGDLYIEGGTTVTYGIRQPECGIDAAERRYVYFTGGNLFAIGESNSVPSNSTSSQYFIQISRGSVSANTTATVKSGSTTLATFTLPYAASQKNIVITAEGMKSGSYSVTLGNSTNSYTATQYSSGGGQGGPGQRW